MTRSSRPFRAPRAANRRPNLLITAGPTHEPIDGVRYIANRSSGRLGLALADHAAAQGCRVTLLLGPTGAGPIDTRVRVERFRTAADLEGLLRRTFPRCDALIMAAAVADFTVAGGSARGKISRGKSLVLKLKATPDLVAQCAGQRRPDQLVVGFALEPARGLAAAARRKLIRKGLDLIVANPLETMDSPRIRATLIDGDGQTPLRAMSKAAFAKVLIGRVLQKLENTSGPRPE